MPKAGRIVVRLKSALTAVAIALLPILAAPSQARAELKVRSPLVTWQEFEFEHNGLYTIDRGKSPLNGNQSYTFEFGYGLTPWWLVEVEAEAESLPGENIRLNARTLENTFQLLPQGKYWADLGIFAEYANAVVRVPSALTFGPIVQKEAPGVFGATALHTLNVLLTRDIGRYAVGRTGLLVAAQSRLRFHPLFEPGIELYYNIDDVGRAGRFRDQGAFAGPVAAGSYELSRIGLRGTLEYEIGYLFGLTPQSSQGAVRWRFEYEIAF